MATARVVIDAAGRGDRGDAGGRPVEPVKHDENDALLARGDGRKLQAVDVGLIEVVGPGIEHALGQPAVEPLETFGIAVDTLRVFHALERQAERVDRDQAIRMIRPGGIESRPITPVAPVGLPRTLRRRLHLAGAVGRRHVLGALPPWPRDKGHGEPTEQDQRESRPASLPIGETVHAVRAIYAGRSSHIGHQSGVRGKSCAASFWATWVEASSRPAAAASCGSHWPSKRRASSSAESRR